MASSFALRPFSPSPLRLTVDGEVSREENGDLLVRFKLRGEIEHLRIDVASANPERKDELWKKTCFECFIQPEGQESYTEINVSPSGDWACYQFDRYRENRKNAASVSSISSEIVESSNETLIFSFRVPAAVASTDAIRLGVTMVVLDDDNRTTYWAMSHTRSSPDFHDENSFDLKLPSAELS